MASNTTKTELSNALFSAADALRSKMDANEYKNLKCSKQGAVLPNIFAYFEHLKLLNPPKHL